MKIFTPSTEKTDQLILQLDKKDWSAFVLIMAAAMNGKALNKRSHAYKLALEIDNELPIY